MSTRWAGVLSQQSTAADPGLILAESATYWFDTKDIASTSDQTLACHNGSGYLLQRGETTGSESTDPTFAVGGPITHDGTDDYLYLPSANPGALPTFTKTTGSDTFVLIMKVEDYAESGYQPIMLPAYRATSWGLWYENTANKIEMYVHDSEGCTSAFTPDNGIHAVTMSFASGTGTLRVANAAAVTLNYNTGATLNHTGLAFTANTGGFAVTPLVLYALMLFKGTALTATNHSDLNTWAGSYYP